MPFTLQLAAAALAIGFTAAAPAPAEYASYGSYPKLPGGYGKYSSYGDYKEHDSGNKKSLNVQIGPRPYYLVDDMDDGPLKEKLESCSEGPFSTSSFSISHRGAPLMFPEHSKEGYKAAARMGAGKNP